MTIVNYIMAALFAVSAVIQLNDPDPTLWILLYAAASAACLQLGRHRTDWLLPMVVIAAAAGWLGYLTPDLIQEAQPDDLLKSMDDKGGSAELAREAGGLAIVAVWQMIALWRLRFSRARS